MMHCLCKRYKMYVSMYGEKVCVPPKNLNGAKVTKKNPKEQKITKNLDYLYVN